MTSAFAVGFAPSAMAREEGSIAGTWSGGGVVVYASGQRERARCRVTYSGGGDVFIANASCASPSGSVNQSARLHRVGANSFAGNFFNEQYNASGSVSVTVHGASQSLSLRSSAGSANISLRR